MTPEWGISSMAKLKNKTCYANEIIYSIFNSKNICISETYRNSYTSV